MLAGPEVRPPRWSSGPRTSCFKHRQLLPGRPLPDREGQLVPPGPADGRAASAEGPSGAARVCHLDRLIQESVLRPSAVTAAPQPDGSCLATVGSVSRSRSSAIYGSDSCPVSVRSWVSASGELLGGLAEAMDSSRTEQRLTAKLTANPANSCHSLATSADEHESPTCIDGRPRTRLDGRGRVRSPLLYPLSYRGLGGAYPGRDEGRMRKQG
jgi:hypothetical protein